jgi:hypothetical protein
MFTILHILIFFEECMYQRPADISKKGAFRKTHKHIKHVKHINTFRKKVLISIYGVGTLSHLISY